jgi:hypothetical protein
MYLRIYFKVPAFPSAALVKMFKISSSGGTDNPVFVSVRITNGGQLQLWNDFTGLQIGSSSSALSTGQYYRLEIFQSIGVGSTDAVELRLDSNTIVTTSGISLGSDIAPTTISLGWLGNAPGANKIIYLDDFAVNDDQGTDQNTWPGEGKVVLLLPTADSAVGTGWTLGTSTAIAANGFDAVNNKPPVGVADLTAGSDPKQIRNATSNANSNYDATLQSYQAAGIGPDDIVKLIVPIVSTAAPVTTSSKQGTVGVVSNPAIANIALGAAGTAGAFWQGNAAGAYPTGWKWSYGTTTYNPSVTRNIAPVMRITQVTSSTRIAMVDFMGMYIEYEPHEPVAPIIRSYAAARAASY